MVKTAISAQLEHVVRPQGPLISLGLSSRLGLVAERGLNSEVHVQLRLKRELKSTPRHSHLKVTDTLVSREQVWHMIGNA